MADHGSQGGNGSSKSRAADGKTEVPKLGAEMKRDEKKNKKDGEDDPPVDKKATKRVRFLACECNCAHPEEMWVLVPERRRQDYWVRCRCKFCGPVQNDGSRRCTIGLHPVALVLSAGYCEDCEECVSPIPRVVLRRLNLRSSASSEPAQGEPAQGQTDEPAQVEFSEPAQGQPAQGFSAGSSG